MLKTPGIIICSFLVFQSPAGALDLKGLQSLITTNSALLASYEWTVRSAESARERDKSLQYPAITLPLNAGLGTASGFTGSIGAGLALDLQKIFGGYPDASEYTLEKSRLEKDIARLDLEKDVALSYYRLYALREEAADDRKSLDYFNSHLADLERMAALGMDLGLDILRVKAQRDSLSLSIDVEANEMGSILTELGSLAGATLSISSLSFDDLPVLTNGEAVRESNIQKLVGETRQARLDGLDVKIAGKAYELDRLALLPVLRFYYQYSLQVTNFTYEDDHQVGVSLEFPLFDFGGRDSQKQSSLYAFESRKKQDEDFLKKLEITAARLLDSMKKSQSVLRSASANLDNAKKEMDAGMVQYRKGKITETDLLSIALDLSNARKQYYDALYDCLSGRAELDYFFR